MRKQSFTLIELLIVLVIIAILSSLALPVLNNMHEKAIDAEAYNFMGIIARAEKLYYIETNTYAVGDGAIEELSIIVKSRHWFAIDIAGVSGEYFIISARRWYKDPAGDPCSLMISYDSRTGKFEKSLVV